MWANRKRDTAQIVIWAFAAATMLAIAGQMAWAQLS